MTPDEAPAQKHHRSRLIFLTPLEFIGQGGGMRSSKQRSTSKHTFNLQLAGFTPPWVFWLKIINSDIRYQTLLANLPDEQILVHASLITVQSTFLQKWTVGLGQERIDSNPQKRKDGSKQDWPDNDDCGSSVLSAEQTFQERIKVNYHPECKEKLTK